MNFQLNISNAGLADLLPVVTGKRRIGMGSYLSGHLEKGRIHAKDVR